jgi:hypothetical protein
MSRLFSAYYLIFRAIMTVTDEVMDMTEPTEQRQKHFEGVIPEEARTHARAARDELKKTFEAMFPPEVSEHGRQVRREMLMAFRSMIDESLKRMEEKKKA